MQFSSSFRCSYPIMIIFKLFGYVFGLLFGLEYELPNGIA